MNEADLRPRSRLLITTSYVTKGGITDQYREEGDLIIWRKKKI